MRIESRLLQLKKALFQRRLQNNSTKWLSATTHTWSGPQEILIGCTINLNNCISAESNSDYKILSPQISFLLYLVKSRCFFFENGKSKFFFSFTLTLTIKLWINSIVLKTGIWPPNSVKDKKVITVISDRFGRKSQFDFVLVFIDF